MPTAKPPCCIPGFRLKLNRVGPGQGLDGRMHGKIKLLLELMLESQLRGVRWTNSLGGEVMRKLPCTGCLSLDET